MCRSAFKTNCLITQRVQKLKIIDLQIMIMIIPENHLQNSEKYLIIAVVLINQGDLVTKKDIGIW